MASIEAKQLEKPESITPRAFAHFAFPGSAVFHIFPVCPHTDDGVFYNGCFPCLRLENGLILWQNLERLLDL